MSRSVPSSPIAITFSSRRTMVPASLVQRAAAQARIDGLDVDALSAIAGWLLERLEVADDAYVPTRSLWLPASELQSERTRRLIAKVSQLQPNAPPFIVIPIPASGPRYELTRNLELARRVTQGWPVVLGLPPAGLKGGRPHLVQLGGIRRFAEEWDLSVALDLAGPFDPTWEAEAAVARLGQRLRLVRISASAASRTAVGRDRVACRALHAAIDGDHGLDVAIAPARWVPFPITPRVASHGARRAADYIAERAELHAKALLEGISRYEGSPSTRGI